MNGNGKKRNWLIAILVIIAIGALGWFLKDARNKLHATTQSVISGVPTITGPTSTPVGTTATFQLAGFAKNTTYQVQTSTQNNDNFVNLPPVTTDGMGNASYQLYLGPDLNLPDTATLHIQSGGQDTKLFSWRLTS